MTVKDLFGLLATAGRYLLLSVELFVLLTAIFAGYAYSVNNNQTGMLFFLLLGILVEVTAGSWAVRRPSEKASTEKDNTAGNARRDKETRRHGPSAAPTLPPGVGIINDEADDEAAVADDDRDPPAGGTSA